MQLSLSLSLTGRLLSSFSPLRLFQSNEVGAFYDPSDVANLDWRRNLLTYSEQFDNAAWGKGGATITANAAVAPDGTTTADLVLEDTSTGPHRVFQTVTIPAATHAFSFYAKPSGRDWVYVYVNGGVETAFVNVFTGAIGTVVGSPNLSVTPVGNGWYRISLGFSNTLTAAQNIQIWASSANGATNYTGNGTSGILIWGAQLETGSTATEYQRITDVNTEVRERFPTATLYQDTAGTTPVTTAGQSVALVLDKSRGLVLGSELVTNGDFSSATGWTLGAGWTISGGQATFTATGANSAITTVATSAGVSGRMYEIRYTVVSNTLNGGAFRIGAFSGNSYFSSLFQLQTTPGTYVARLSSVPSGTGTVFDFWVTSGATSGSITIDNISVRELSGAHATQSTAASRPLYGVVPATGRRNLLTYSEQFDNAAWAKSATTISQNSTTAPDDTATADKVVEAASGSASRRVDGPAIVLTAANHTFSVYAKASELGFVRLSEASSGSARTTWFNVSSGAVGTTAAGHTATITSVGDGWYRCSIAFLAGTFSHAPTIGMSPADNQTTYTGVGGQGLFIWGAQLETGSTATAYQRVVSALDVTEAGVQSLSYLSFDGVDDFLVTPTITPATDKAQVFAGVRKLSDADQSIIEFSANYNTNNGSFVLFNDNGSGTRLALASGVRGLTLNYGVPPAQVSPVTLVAAQILDIGASTAVGENTLRINGAVQALSYGSATDAGTSNFLAYPLYIGRRGGTTSPFNGHLYGLIVRFGANLDAGTISQTETWVNGKTRAY